MNKHANKHKNSWIWHVHNGIKKRCKKLKCKKTQKNQKYNYLNNKQLKSGCFRKTSKSGYNDKDWYYCWVIFLYIKIYTLCWCFVFAGSDITAKWKVTVFAQITTIPQIISCVKMTSDIIKVHLPNEVISCKMNWDIEFVMT